MNRGSVLVTGGAGYIGSHTTVELIEAGYEVIVVDNFSNSDASSLDGVTKITGVRPTFIEGDCCDKEFMRSVFERYDFDSVIHFAAYKAVGESVAEPLKYYRNNILSFVTILELMAEYGRHNILFSSSATVYGDAEILPVTELTPRKPATSPYGNPSALIGELPRGVPNNLVPYVTQTAAGIRECLSIFGGDYPTPDGSCLRDYIDVVDLARAHVVAIARMAEGKSKERYEVFNIGTGSPVSVFELVRGFEEANNLKLNYKVAPRRAGDVVAVWADTTLANNELGWRAERKLSDTLKSAWAWEKNVRGIE